MIAPIDQIAGHSVSLAQIEPQCERYENESARLEQLIAALESELETVKQKHLRAIKRQAGVVAGCEAELESLIEDAPELFIRPRTITLHGVKVGYTASSGRVEFDDEDSVIARIKKSRPEDADLLIRKTEEVNKEALRQLPADELFELGCQLEGAGDTIVLKRVAGEVEKLVNRLITKLVDALSNCD
jgi:arsenate reductase-like glutaredoxin family protein